MLPSRCYRVVSPASGLVVTHISPLFFHIGAHFLPRAAPRTVTSGALSSLTSLAPLPPCDSYNLASWGGPRRNHSTPHSTAWV